VACRKIQRFVFLWIDRDREALPRERVERHLDDCPHCRERATEIERIVAMVRRRCPRESVPATLIERIRIRIETD